MKYIKVIITILVLAFFTQCKTSQVAYFPNAELVYINSEGDQLTLRMLGYGVNEQAAIFNAQINAFDNLFFRGIPNSPYNTPLIGTDEGMLKNKNASYFQNFYGGKRLLNFINGYSLIAADKTTVLARKIKNKTIVQGNVESIAAFVEITINIKSIRKDLENCDVIRPFGY